MAEFTKLTPTMARLIGNAGYRFIMEAHGAGIWTFDGQYPNGNWRSDDGKSVCISIRDTRDLSNMKTLATYTFNFTDTVDEDTGENVRGVMLCFFGEGQFDGAQAFVTCWFKRPTFWLQEGDYERDVEVRGNPTMVRKLLEYFHASAPVEAEPA